MNVGDLKTLLEGWPEELLVVMSSDGEGNQHSPLADIGEMRYMADSTYSGDTYHTHEWIQAHKDWGYTEEDEAPDDAVPCVCLWPTN